MSSTGAVAATFSLRCIACSAACSETPTDFRCPACRDLLEVVYPWSSGTTSCTLDALSLRKCWRERRASPSAIDQSGVWRFRELLPFLADPQQLITLCEGNTPLYQLPRCALSAGVDQLWAKHQGMNPTGSFKDTGMTVALSMASEKGFRWVACASTGNTAASMAAYAARAGFKSLVIVPESQVASGKLAQIVEHGAIMCQLRTDFDGCVRVLDEVIRRFPVHLVNSVNPFRIEGQKTAAFELLEQLEWSVPDHVIVPGGNLANASALGKGFLELRSLGFVESLPKISVIQAIGANPLVRSFRETQGRELTPIRAETRATAIRIGNPASWKKAVAVLKTSGGTCEEVSEEEIAIAKAEIGREGVGCEPASSATLAGLKRLVRRGFVKKEDSVVLVLTGHLLKDPEYTFETKGCDSGAAACGTRLENSAAILAPTADAVLRRLEAAGD
jgi:threonine synthase